MARPTDEDAPRSETIRARVTDEEREALEALADECGTTISGLIRSVVTKETVTKAVRTALGKQIESA